VLVFAEVFYRVFLEDRGHLVWWLEWQILTGSFISALLPELLLLCGVLSGGKDGIENILCVCVGQVLRIYLDVLNQHSSTFTCFFPELDTKTGLEYLTKLWGWLKFVGP
jgi:hypothetical protein